MKCPICGAEVKGPICTIEDRRGWWQGMHGDWHNTELMDKMSPRYKQGDTEDDGEE